MSYEPTLEYASTATERHNGNRRPRHSDEKAQRKYSIHNEYKLINERMQFASLEGRAGEGGFTSLNDQLLEEVKYTMGKVVSPLAMSALFLTACLLIAGWLSVALEHSLFMFLAALTFCVFFAYSILWPANILYMSGQYAFTKMSKKYYDKFMPIWNSAIVLSLLLPAALCVFAALYPNIVIEFILWPLTSFVSGGRTGLIIGRIKSTGDALGYASIYFSVLLALLSVIYFLYVRSIERRARKLRQIRHMEHLLADTQNAVVAAGVLDGKYEFSTEATNMPKEGA